MLSTPKPFGFTTTLPQVNQRVQQMAKIASIAANVINPACIVTTTTHAHVLAHPLISQPHLNEYVKQVAMVMPIIEKVCEYTPLLGSLVQLNEATELMAKCQKPSIAERMLQDALETQKRFSKPEYRLSGNFLPPSRHPSPNRDVTIHLTVNIICSPEEDEK